jgi:hypothetical protein
MICIRSAGSITLGRFRNSTAGFLPSKRALNTCAGSGGLKDSVAPPVVGVKHGQLAEACCAARHASGRCRLLPGRSSKVQGNRFGLGFKLCGL